MTGHWDGQPIWRERTAEEVLIQELNKMDKEKERFENGTYPFDENEK